MMNKHKWMALVFLGAIVLSACRPSAEGDYVYSPPEDMNDSIRVGSLGEVGIDDPTIEMAINTIASGAYDEIHSLLIYRDGKLVLEEYFPGHQYRWDGPGFHGDWVEWDANAAHEIMSDTKSIISACMGIAINEGYIASVDQSIFDYLPNYQQYNNEGREQITIEHLVTMSSGFQWDEWSSYVNNLSNDLFRLYVDACPDSIECLLERPLADTPGTKFVYNGGGINLMAAIIENASGMGFEEFVAIHLFEPLGAENYYWRNYYFDGRVAADGGLMVRPRDMLKFGLLYLNDGAWMGEQIIPEYWVERSATPYDGGGNAWLNTIFSPKPPSDDSFGRRGYSYTWWTHRFSQNGNPLDVFWAGGWGGQKIFVIPDLDAVVVMTAGNYSGSDTTVDLFRDYVLRAME